MGGAPPRSARSHSLARSLVRRRRLKRPTPRGYHRTAATRARCRADHDDAPGTLRRPAPHDHQTPSILTHGITAARSAHVHCVPWKFERAPSAMLGETLAVTTRIKSATVRRGCEARRDVAGRGVARPPSDGGLKFLRQAAHWIRDSFVFPIYFLM